LTGAPEGIFISNPIPNPVAVLPLADPVVVCPAVPFPKEFKTPAGVHVKAEMRRGNESPPDATTAF
jgi:hypothetical protein